MGRIQFCMLPEAGHILPTLRIAQLLKAKGHAVCYSAISELHNYLHRHGFQHKAIFREILPAATQRDILGATPGIETYSKIQYFFESTNTDFGMALASELHHEPFDLLICDSEIVRKWGKSLALGLRKAILPMSVTLPDITQVVEQISAEIILCPKEFDLPWVGDGPTSRVYAEPSIFRARRYLTRDRLMSASSQPMIYCSFGTQTTRYANRLPVLLNLIEAFSMLPYQVVMTMNQDPIAALIDRCPANVLLTDDAPQLAMLERAILFVSHGGLGGIKESIMSGVPLLVIPFDMDQPHNARRVAFHMLGDVCNPEDTAPAHVRRLIYSILNDRQIPERISAMRRAFVEREVKAPSVEVICKQLANS